MTLNMSSTCWLIGVGVSARYAIFFMRKVVSEGLLRRRVRPISFGVVELINSIDEKRYWRHSGTVNLQIRELNARRDLLFDLTANMLVMYARISNGTGVFMLKSS